MSDDLLIDFGQSIFDLAGNALGLGGVEMTLGKLAIEALAHESRPQTLGGYVMSEAEKLQNYNIIKKIDAANKSEDKIAVIEAHEVPILRRAINRTVDIITFGRVHDILESAPVAKKE